MTFEVAPAGAGRIIAECDARRVRMARRVTAARLRFCGLDELLDDAVLLVSELVTNAIVHSGGTQITFTMAVREHDLCLSVHDEMPGGPTVCTAEGDAERGRGLFLVERLTKAHRGAWGISDGGATTWCSLALSGVQQ
ncbi:ATP-binding protein [Streptomyces nodosus]